jgi:ABC-2 type transport system ATP-binding protein
MSGLDGRARGFMLGAALFALISCFANPAAAQPTERGAVRSFDGTPIVYNLFLPADASATHPVAVIFQGHGYAGSGQTTLSGFVKRLVDADFAVVTFDHRGFGDSGGEVEIDAPFFEGRDTSAIIDFIGNRPEILCEGGVSCASPDSDHDPRLGFEGGSYAGGIQLATAAFDKRVDAIVPDITWNDLRYSLFPGGVIKLGWDELLYGAGLATSIEAGIDPNGPAGIQTGNYPLELNVIEAKGTVLGYADRDTLEFFLARSLVGYGVKNPIKIPALFTQGVCDTLFTPNEALANFAAVTAQGAPARVLLKSSGHVSCPYPAPGNGDLVANETFSWLACYVRGDADQCAKFDPATPIEYLTSDGVTHASATFPPAGTDVVTVHAAGMVINTAAKTSIAGALGTSPGTGTVLAASPSGANDPGTLTVDTGIVGDGQKTIVGIPHVVLTVSGTGLGTHLFFKLVDREASQVLDLQETALRIDGLGSGPYNMSFDMTALTYVVPSGHHVDLEIATSSAAMSEYRLPSLVNVDATVGVPVL